MTKMSKTGGWGWVGLEKIEAMWLHICEASEAIEGVWDWEAISLFDLLFCFLFLFQNRNTSLPLLPSVFSNYELLYL